MARGLLRFDTLVKLVPKESMLAGIPAKGVRALPQWLSLGCELIDVASGMAPEEAAALEAAVAPSTRHAVAAARALRGLGDAAPSSPARDDPRLWLCIGAEVLALQLIEEEQAALSVLTRDAMRAAGAVRAAGVTLRGLPLGDGGEGWQLAALCIVAEEIAGLDLTDASEAHVRSS